MRICPGSGSQVVFEFKNMKKSYCPVCGKLLDIEKATSSSVFSWIIPYHELEDGE